MIYLFLTMLRALEQFSESELNYTKKDLNKIIKKYNLEKEYLVPNVDFNEAGVILLYRNEYMSTELLEKNLDIKYENDSIYLSFPNFDFLGRDYEYEAEFLSGDFDRDYNNWEADVSDYWSDYNNETLKEIITYCVDNELEIEGEVLTDKNIILENSDIYFINSEGEKSKLINHIDELDELESILRNSICDAQRDAEYDECYKIIKKNFNDTIGEFQYNDKDWIDIKLNISLSEVEKWVYDNVGEFNFEDKQYGNLEYLLKDMEYFEFKKPNYDYIYSDIDNDNLNEITQDRLKW